MFTKKMFILVILAILVMVSSVSFVNAECNDDCLWDRFLELYDAEKVTVAGNYDHEKYVHFQNKSDYEAFTKNEIQRLGKILKDHLKGGDRVETIEMLYKKVKGTDLWIKDCDVDVREETQETIVADNEDEGLDDATRLKNYCVKYIAKLQSLNVLAFDPYSSTTMNAYVDTGYYFGLKYQKKHVLGVCCAVKFKGESMKNIYLFAAGYSPGPESLLLECKVEDTEIAHYQ